VSGLVAADAKFDDFSTKFDRTSMLRSIEKLALAIDGAKSGTEALAR
jgi:hypothetical protein